MSNKSRKAVRTLVACAAMGAATSVFAAPTFDVNLNSSNSNVAIPGGITLTANKITGSSSELLATTGNTHSGSGWMAISSMELNGTSVASFGNFNNIFAPTDIYITFQLKDHLTGGTINTAGSTYALDQLDFQVWLDKAKDTTFTAANVVGNVSTAATVTTNGNDVLLGFGSLLQGVAGLSALGGANLNSINSFLLCNGAGTATVQGVTVPAPGCTGADGTGFFTAPIPFFTLAFTEFNNTSQGFAVNGSNGDLAITQASGSVDFNKVPEPGSLALLGVGLLGFGAARRRKQ